MTVNAYVGWDIGGAHLKVAQVDRAGKVIFARQFATPLWQGIDILSQSLEQSRNLITEKSVRHAVTTTAELVDIFPDRISGLKQLTECITAILDKNSIQYFSGKSGWISTASTAEFANQIASANWYATASFIAKHFDNGIMLDIGSTTTDIVAFTNGEILNRGYSDYERLACGELVYTGIIRTPVMALVQELPVDSAWCPVIAEHFATMADVYRLTGELQEEDDMLDTADRAGKSVLGSTRRLARMVGKDIYTGEAIADWLPVAQYIAETQQNRILHACKQVLSNLQDKRGITMIGAGAGRFLVAKLAECLDCKYQDFADILDVADELKPSVARSATAIAVAQLARLSD